MGSMHPAEHRGLRELYAAAGQLRRHWQVLAQRLEATGAGAVAAPLRAGADAALELLKELSTATAARGLHGRPAAQGLGARIAATRTAVVDPALEVNQAARLAALDAGWVVTTLGYLERLASRRGDAELASFLTGWAQRMGACEDAIRAAAIALGDDPDAAIVPATPGLRGRLGHAAASAVGSAGEWFDRRAGR